MSSSDVRRPGGRSRLFWSCLATLVAIGGLGLSPQFMSLWNIWTTDPLRSIGMLIVPAGIVLFLRVWRQNGWELRGTWWGLAPIALAFFSIVSSQNLVLSWGAGTDRVNVLPHVLPIYLYASGVVLLFAGVRVWRQAWFPLGLLLLAQPVPAILVHTLDIPLQSLSAHIARSFASLIGFPPSSPELLRLMFTPDFGMFIAPGCDGMRGAITLGYAALIVGYLKRVSILRWILYVVGAVFLGHLFNLIRLCFLVLYYRVAVGHPALENVAKQADYVIGGLLFLAAGVIFFWVALRRTNGQSESGDHFDVEPYAATQPSKWPIWQTAAFAVLVLIATVPGLRAIQLHRQSLAADAAAGDLTPEKLDERMTKQFGDYARTRIWQENQGETTVLEAASYAKAGSGEATLGIWLPATGHNMHESWMTRGESPEMRADKSFTTAQGRPVSFDTALYRDGDTDTLAGSTNCTPSYCLLSTKDGGGIHLGFIKSSDYTTRGVRLVPIFFRVERLHQNVSDEEIYKQLLADSQSFLAGVDFGDLSRKYQ